MWVHRDNHHKGGAISNLEDVVVQAIMLINLIHGAQSYSDDKMLVQDFTVQHSLVEKGAPYPGQPTHMCTEYTNNLDNQAHSRGPQMK